MKKIGLLVFSVILTTILVATVLATVKLPSGQTSQIGAVDNAKPHFSVKWMGYAPDTNATWPTLQPYTNYSRDFT